jgi:RNA polymerase sigma-70 factor (ECF subfamily)
LLARVRTPADFAPLYERYVEPVYRYCLRRVSDPELAADLTASIFTRALEALAKFRPDQGGTFRSWLFVIAHNVVVDAYRQQRPTGVMPEDQPDHGIGPEEWAVHRDEFERLVTVLDQLPHAQRQIIDLRLAGLTTAEIADVLGLSRAAVKSAQTRAYARLRLLLTVPTDGVTS